MIKQQNAGTDRSSRRRAGTGRAALMLSAGTLAMVLAQPALAQVAPGTLPSGGTIVGGTGSIDFAGTDMTVTQTSDRLLINWGSFDIGSGATVHFDMAATDIAVNRDTAGDPSEIYGALSGDGMIMILNPNGVLFGAGANVNVGSLVATTAGLTDLNAISGSMLNFSGAGGGSISIAAGATITVAEAGLAAFVAPGVSNEGIITATAGHVLLGGADGFTLDLANDGLLELTVPTASPLVQNHGSIFAEGGRIQMSAAAAAALVGTVINTSGVLSVASASSDDGVIVLEAAGNDIEVSSDLSAEGDIAFSARRVHGAGDVDVADGALTLNIDPDGADTTGETLIADALGVIGAVEGGTTLNLAAGDYAAGAAINAANVTVDGGGAARIIADQNGQDGLTVNGTGDGAVIQGLTFIGQADTSYNGFAWGSTITRGVVLRNGAENVTVTDNVITGVRNGILIDGRNNGSIITDNVIDNTKSAISVQYTDGSNLTLTGNAEGVFGNEWGINVHLNGVWNGSTISPSAGSLGANPSAGAQQHLLDLSNANGGMSVYNQAYSASNRTHVHVDAGGSPSGQGAAPTPISTVHGGVAAVVNGGQVFVADGVYNFAGSRLIINKSLTLTGESEEGVILDGRSVGGGLGTVLVSADNVTLSNFTLYGADSGSNNYGIKVQPNPTGYDPNQRLYNFSINDVTVRGSTRAELDLNGVVGATITNFTADGRRVGDDSHESGGAGVQITDSADITLTGVTTLGNAWGSVAIYQTNAAGAYNGLTNNINIDAGENTFNEFLGLFVQSYSTLHPEIGQLNLTGFDYAVRNTGHRANGDQFTFFRTDLDDAADFALNIGAAETSSIEGWSGTDYTNEFTVVEGLTIRSAVRDVRDGGFINVGAGTFVEDDQLLIAVDLTLTGEDGTVIEAGRNFTGSAPGQAWWLVDEGVTFNLSNVALDGAGFNVAYGLRNHGHTTIDGVTFRNIVSPGYSGIAVASFGGDVAGGAGVGSWADSSLTITNSAFENIGRIGVLMKGDGATALIEDSTFTGRGEGDHVEYAIEAGASGSIEVLGNTISGYRGVAASDGSTSAGVLVTSYYGGASYAVIENNIISGNTSAVAVGYGGSDVSVVTAFSNDLSGNDFGVSLNPAASADFSGNWWGSADEAAILAYMGGTEGASVDFSTYLTSGADTDVTDGFQGDLSDIGVTALGGQTGVGGRIQEGLNLVDTGGVVRVGAGDFGDRTIVLSRSVTLQGAQGGQAAATGDGEASVGDRGGETILTGAGPYVFNVAAEDVTIDGFTFTGAGGRLIITSGTANRLSILNNIFDTPSGHAGNGLITLTGTARDVLIANNLFSGDGGAGYLWASGGAGDGLQGLTVQDNDFSGVSERGIFQGGQQFSGFDLSGNYFGSGILTGVNMGHLINPLIAGNHFDGVGYAAMQIGVIGGGTIRDNLVDGTGVAGYDFGAYAAAYGIQIWGGAYGTPSSEGLVIEGNTVLNYVGAGADDRFVGIYIGADAGPNLQVTGNTLSGNSIGLWAASAASGLTLSGNTFTVAADGLAIRNSGSALIELMGGANTINGVDTDAASLDELFGIEDLIDHGLDQTGYGLVRVADGQLFVTQDSGSIQRAVDLAGAGNTINVGAGTFGGFATAFGGPADLTIHTANGAVIDATGVPLASRIIDLRADGATVSGFTILGDGNGVGFSVSGRGVSIIGNTIDGVLTGVQTTTQYAAGNATITGNTITADYGVSLQNTGNTVSGNTVNAAVEGVGLLQSANSLSGNTFNVAAGADALNYYGAATYVGLTASDNTVAIEGGGLQGALDLAGSGGSVDAGAATYNETATIRHSLTLAGAGQADTVINGGIVIAGHAPAGSSIDGLTIEGLTVNAGAGQVGLIALSNSVDGVYNTTNLTVTDVTINGNGQHAVGLFDVNGATFDNVTINAAAGFNGVEALGLNGFFMDGGAVNGALTGVNVWELAGYEANGGLVFLGVDFAGNRTHLSLEGAGAVLDAILSANSFDRTVHATGGDAIYGDLAWAVGDAAAGSELNLSADTFALTSALVIDRTLSLVGAGQGQTIIDASGAATYGIRVHADDVSLSDFTLSGGSGYGIKVEAAGSPTPGQRRTGFSIADVTIENTGRTGLDLNAVIGALIDGVTVTGVANGNGISITDSADITVRNSTTSGNAWAGLGLFQRNNIGGGGSDQQLTGIVIEDSNDFGEETGVYVQAYNSALHDIGALTVSGFDFVVQNDDLDGGVSSYVFFDRTLQDAIDRGVNLVNASESVVGGWAGSDLDGNLYVGFGELIGGGQSALSIQSAFDASDDGDTIHIAGGDYGQSATLDEARTVLFDDLGVGMVDLTFALGASGSGVSGRVDATGDIVFEGGVVLVGGTTLTADTVTLAGVEGSSANGQTLMIDADAIGIGSAGAATALRNLMLFGDATLTGSAYNAFGFSVSGDTTLANDVSITVSGPLVMGAVNGAHALSISAGGPAALGEVGAIDALTGLDVTASTITTAGATTTGDQSYSGALTLNGDYAAGGSFTVDGATTLGGATSLDAASINMASVDGEEDLTLAATGAVILGSVGSTEALASLTASGASITTAGAITTGDQSYSGALTLTGDYAAGGDFSVNGATTLGGDVEVDASAITFGAVDGGHDLSLTADGSISLEAAGADEALASLSASGAAITTSGAVTTGAQSYAGDVTLDGDYAAGGAFSVNGAAALGGDVGVDASAITLGAVDGGHGLSLTADGAVSLGAVGAGEALASLAANGASITTAGTATTGAQSYTGALALNGDYAAGGGFSVNGATTLAGDVQIISQGGDVMLGLIDGAHGLTITADVGDVALGPVGSAVAVDDLTVSGGVVTTAGAASTGVQSWSGDEVRLSGTFTTAGGDFTVSGPAILNGATTITTSGGDASMGSVDGAVAGGQAFRLNAGAGSVELGSLGALARLGATVVRASSTVLNGDTYAANSLSFMGAGADATVRLTELLTTFNTVQSADQAGAISITPHLVGTVDGQQGVVFLAGTGASAGDGAITLRDAGTGSLRLGLMTATGGHFSAQTVMLAGDFTSTLSGDQVFSDDTLDTLGDVNMTVAGNERGPINAGGSVTINTGGSANGAITAGGPVNVTSGGNSNRNIVSGGAVTLTSTAGSVSGSVQTTGPVTISSAGTITGSYASGGTIILNAGQPINVQVNGGVIQVNAPGGVVGGVFNQISTDARGTFVINGEAVIGTGSADARQILTDGFIAPVGGVVGPTGLIQLPVGLALALISPAGEGQGQRPAVLVNDVNRLGELLRLGYTAIVIQIDESGLLIEEELILADTEQQSAGVH